MIGTRRKRSVLLVALLFAWVGMSILQSGPAAATEEPEPQPEPEQISEDFDPAVEAPPEDEAEEDLPWTARYLAPTLLVLGVIAVIAAIGYYVVRLRGRYNVVND